MSALNIIEDKPELSIIFVNYNDKVHLKECLSSLEASPLLSHLEIIVVDNNSSDGSQEFIKSHFPRAKLICNKENIGFARASNQGIRQSRGDFVLFLNTDTTIFPESLSLLLREIKTNHQAGAVGPALLKGENRYQISFGWRRGFGSELLQKCFFNPFYRMKLKRAKKKREVGWLSAACLLVRKDVLEEVNLFDEDFFLYFEDIDLCFRIREKGWKLICLPQVKVFHRGGASTSYSEFSSRYEYRKSQLYFYQKHTSKVSLFLLHIYLLLNFSLLFIFNFLGKDRDLGRKKRFFKLLRNYKSKYKG